jgi:hypothetical protein
MAPERNQPAGWVLPSASNRRVRVERMPLASQKCHCKGASRGRSPAIMVLTLAAGLGLCGSAVAAQRFQADDWITECGGRPGGSNGDCSITVPFWQAGGGKGSFALVVMLETGNIGIVGSPPPLRAVLRVDKNPAAECRGSRYCIFPVGQSLALVKQLDIGSLILIDVFTAKSQFSFSLSPKGYRAGVAQIRAWGYQVSAN